MTGKDVTGETKAVATDSIEVQDGGRRAAVSVPGQAGHRPPGQRAEVVDEVLDDPRVQGGEQITVAVPTGDAEALEQVRERLDVTSTRPAGSTVIVEAQPPGDDSET